MKKIKSFIFLVAIFASIISCSKPIVQNTEDAQQIKQAALYYFEGWYERDTIRLDRALHKDLAKRYVEKDKEGTEYLHLTVKDDLISHQIKKINEGSKGVKNNSIRIDIYDIHNGIASAMVESEDYYDYIHLAKINNKWEIVNVLWERKPIKN